MAAAKEIADLLLSKSSSVKKHSETPVAERQEGSESKKRGPAGPASKSPPNKVAKTKSFSKKLDPQAYIGARVSKMFGADVYYGTITSYIPAPSAKDDDLWHVLYDDDDSEDFDAKDLKKALNLYRQKEAGDPNVQVGVASEEQATGDDDTEIEAEVVAEVAGDDAPPLAPPALDDTAPIAMEVDAEPAVAAAASAPAPPVDV